MTNFPARGKVIHRSFAPLLLLLILSAANSDAKHKARPGSAKRDHGSRLLDEAGIHRPRRHSTGYTAAASEEYLHGTQIFDPTSPTNVTAQLDRHAYLPCKIKKLDNKSVSWVRQRDAQILSIGNSTFYRDPRFKVIHSPETRTWTLQILFVRESDAGQYECQVSTQPKSSRFLHLNVLVPTVEIVTGSDIYVNSGSPAEINCKITHTQEDQVIFWYKDNERLLPDDEGFKSRASNEFIGRMEGRKVPQPSRRRQRLNPDVIIESLIIHRVQKEHEGNYTCFLSDSHKASSDLHVLSGKTPQAIQDRTNGTFSQRTNLIYFFLGLMLFKFLLTPP